MDDFFSAVEASRHIPGKPAYLTIYRWMVDGLKTRSGQLVFLDHQQVGRKRLTSIPMIQKFLSDIAAADSCGRRRQLHRIEAKPKPIKTNRQEAVRAMEALAADGI